MQVIVKNWQSFFFDQCRIIWGDAFIVYNVHSLIHLVEDVAYRGSVDNFSCFGAENFLRYIKYLPKSGTYVLQQAVKRVHERGVTLGHMEDPVTKFVPATFTDKERNDGMVRYCKKVTLYRKGTAITISTDKPDNFLLCEKRV